MAELRYEVGKIEFGVDVLVCHCPPCGVLDKVEQYGDSRFGNLPLINRMNYEDVEIPELILCGHLHDGKGKEVIFEKCLVINSATTYHVVAI